MKTNKELLKTIEPTPELLRIIWVDAVTIGDSGWLPKTEASKHASSNLPLMSTVGYVLYVDKLQIALTNTVGPDETAQVNKIPWSMVLQVTSLIPNNKDKKYARSRNRISKRT